MLSITRVALATQPNRNPGPAYGTYLTITTSVPVSKGHRECIIGAVASFNNQKCSENERFRVGFNGSIVLGRPTLSTFMELAKLIEYVAGCIGHAGELPGVEGDGDLINPGLALVLPGSIIDRQIRPGNTERGNSQYRGRRPRRRDM